MSTQTTVPVLSALKKGQLFPETTYGTPGTPTIELAAIKISPKPKLSADTFKALGYRFATGQVLNEKATELGFEGFATYGTASSSEPGIFCPTIANEASVTPDSYTVVAGGHGYPGAVVSAWTLSGDRKQTKISGSMIARWMATQAEGALTPAAPDPILPSQITISLGETEVALTRVVDWELACSNLQAAAFFLGDLENGAVGAPEDGSITFRVGFEANATNDAVAALTGKQLIWSILATKVAGTTRKWSGIGEIAEVEAFKTHEGIIYAYGVKLNVLCGATNAVTFAAADAA
jgi:hypothetical protein